jgi:5-formyltetrahydrofolate cyclo-ligase
MTDLLSLVGSADLAAMDVADAKQVLRAHIRERRGARSVRRRGQLAEDLAAVALEMVDGARCVACYVARPTEPGTTPLLAALARLGIRVLLPVLGPGLQRTWAPYRGADDLMVRAPGRPPEPSGTPSGPESLAEAEIILVPALSIDRDGYRLGQGGGWYDRALRHAAASTPVIAVIFDDEYLVDARLPREEHDVPVHAVMTPSRWLRIN